MNTIMPRCTVSLYHFDRVTYTELINIILVSTSNSDPPPPRLVRSHLHAIIPIPPQSVNIYGEFPSYCIFYVIPLIKKTSLDREMYTDYKPVSNLFYPVL